MPLNAFIVRPFGVKELVVTDSKAMPSKLENHAAIGAEGSPVRKVEKIADAAIWRVSIDFDLVHKHLIGPALARLNIRGETATAVVVAGNIREDMFHRLITSDLVIADLSMHNANVFYELGIRQAFRDKYTFLVRCNLSEYPFDLKTDRYFDYDVLDLLENGEKTAERLAEALRATIMSYKADSPVFKLLPQLEAEDRSRFIAVPDEFREEVERARQLRLPEHLRMLAVECEDSLWEVEGLRQVGRAQFESNFIDDAKVTWEQIVNRYPDDIEANTTLSTVYQRRNDAARSEQALARVSRMGTLTANRQSQLRSLNGRNLKEAWTKKWDRPGLTTVERQRLALSSPLLQRSFDAFEESFKGDLNNAYAGLNALTLLVIQTELARKLPDVWQRVQRRPADAAAEQRRRAERIGQLICALELAVESERDRLRREGVVDVWFSLLDASVASIVSTQPEYVAQLYEDARHFAPSDSDRSMRRALSVYQKLQIEGRDAAKPAKGAAAPLPADGVGRTVGTIGRNVERALQVLAGVDDETARSREPRRILMFAGLRLNLDVATSNPRPGFPRGAVDEAKGLIRKAIEEEQALATVGGTRPRIAFGMAAAAHGAELLFHEVCHELNLPTRLCLALPRAEYIGRYVSPAGADWVERFSAVYRHVDEMCQQNAAQKEEENRPWTVNCFTDSNDLPRWLQGRPYYNVGRRNNLWMLQHAIVTANLLGENTEITLIVLYDSHSELGIGGIGHLVAQAEMAGIKVKRLQLAAWQEAQEEPTSTAPSASGAQSKPQAAAPAVTAVLPTPAAAKTVPPRPVAAAPRVGA
jgi:hypothetical protein